MNLKLLMIPIALVIGFPLYSSTCYAQEISNPYDLDELEEEPTEEESWQPKNENQATWSTAMGELLESAGELKPKKKTTPRWENLKKYDDPEVEEHYTTALEWKMKRARSAPLPKRKTFGSNRLSEIEGEIDGLRPNKKQDLDKEYEKYLGKEKSRGRISVGLP